MKNALSLEHKKQLEEIKKNLAIVGAREGNFIRIELLFYEAMTVARAYGDNMEENGLLAAFKKLQANEYQETKELFRKSGQREKVIRRFISGLKRVLTAGTKNAFFLPSVACS